MRQVVAIVLVLVLVATVLSVYPAQGIQENRGTLKVPIVNFISVGFGDEPFKSTETFQVHSEDSTKHTDSNSVGLSFSDDYATPINDSILLNYSIHISKNPMVAHFPVQNGTINLSIPSQRSYLSTLSISGSTSFSYATLTEKVPADALSINTPESPAPLKVWEASIYNLTVQYGNSSFELYSPGYVKIGSHISQVSLTVENESGYSLLSFSFPIKDGNFSFAFTQALSSQQDINGYVMSYYQLPGFANSFLDNLLSNSISLSIGGAIFLFLVIGLFIYYKKK